MDGQTDTRCAPPPCTHPSGFTSLPVPVEENLQAPSGSDPASLFCGKFHVWDSLPSFFSSQEKRHSSG